MNKIIIFDLSEVYLKGLKGLEVYLEDLLGIDNSIINNSFFNDDLIKLFQGKISEDVYFNSLINENNWNIDVLSLKNLVRKNFEEIEGTRYIIETLKSKGYKLGLLSVHAKEWIDYCNDKYDFHKLFDKIVYSFDIGYCKPEIYPYQFIMNLFKESGNNILFIDDNKSNVNTASSLGMNTILFKDSIHLIEDLSRFGIFI